MIRQPGVLVAATICDGLVRATGVAEIVVRIFPTAVFSAEADAGSTAPKDSTRERSVISVSRRRFFACITFPSGKRGGVGSRTAGFVMKVRTGGIGAGIRQHNLFIL